jgi:hypothetical protein
VVGLSAAIARSAPEQDERVAKALATVLGWAGGFWRTLFVCVLGLALVIVVDVLVQRRWKLVRDLLATALVLFAAAPLLGGAVESNWLPVERHVLLQRGYPELRLAGATAVLVVIGPELVRPVRLLGVWLVPLAALGADVDGWPQWNGDIERIELRGSFATRGRSQVTYRMEIDGPTADTLGPELCPAISADFPETLAALDARAEAGSPDPS